MPHEDYCYALERENHALNEKYESLRQQLELKHEECISFYNEAETVIKQRDEARQQLVTLKTELKSIGEAIDDPRTDLTMTMSEVIVEQKQQLAAALAAIKVKNEAIMEARNWNWLDDDVGNIPVAESIQEALAIKPTPKGMK